MTTFKLFITKPVSRKIALLEAKPGEWIFSIDNWMMEAVTVLVRARQP